MKTNLLFLLMVGLASGLFSLFSCNSDLDDKPAQPAKPIELTLRQSEILNADNRFTFRMFREVSEVSDPNTFFSPLSLNMALGMLYNGSSGDTRTRMAETLGMADFTDAEINEYYQKMSQALLKADPSTELSIANSIWYRNGFSVKQPFIDVNKKYFDAAVKSLDFSKPDAANVINKWCADKTKNRIREIVPSPIPGNVMMYVINALYFKSKWKSKFDKANTKQASFTRADNSTINVNMMEQTSTLPYYADEYLQCVEMTYGNEAFSMVAVLGAEDMGIDRLIEYLDDETWQNIVGNMYGQKVWLKLPRFKIECEMDLNDPVKNVGMVRIFLGGFENISNIELVVSAIRQKTFVEVNEEGTEAAAVTVVGIVESAGPDQNMPVPFFANRPFLYLIKEKSTGVILFIGRMDEPQE